MKYAPRLKSLALRTQNTIRIPSELRTEIHRTARQYKCSVSWIVEQIVLEWAGIPIEYIESNSRNGHRKGRK